MSSIHKKKTAMTKASIILAALSDILLIKQARAISIPTYIMPSPNRSGRQWSKRTLQRMKGKKMRRNRGRNRARYSAKGIIKRGGEKNALRAYISAELGEQRDRAIGAQQG